MVRFNELMIWFASAIMAVLPASTSRAQSVNDGNPDAGYALYAENCAACHGANLEGQPDWRSPNADGVLPAPPHDRTGHTWHHGDKLLFDYTKLGGQEMLKRLGVTVGNSGMPSFAERLTDQQILDILAFIKSTWPEREQDIQRQRTEAERPQNS